MAVSAAGSTSTLRIQTRKDLGGTLIQCPAGAEPITASPPIAPAGLPFQPHEWAMNEAEFQTLVSRQSRAKEPPTLSKAALAEERRKLGPFAKKVLDALEGVREPLGTLERAWMGAVRNEVAHRSAHLKMIA